MLRCAKCNQSECLDFNFYFVTETDEEKKMQGISKQKNTLIQIIIITIQHTMNIQHTIITNLVNLELQHCNLESIFQC